jgi:hypothetical protein
MRMELGTNDSLDLAAGALTMVAFALKWRYGRGSRGTKSPGGIS